MNQTTKTQENKCPKCKQRLDQVECVGGAGIPNVGDITVCSYCAQILTYEANGSLRSLTAQEVSYLIAKQRPVWDQIVKATRMIKHANDINGKGKIILP